MKKIITAIMFVALSTVSSNAIGLPQGLSLTGGLAANQGVFGASATQTNYNDVTARQIDNTKKEGGVFTDSYGSQFIELGIGQWISIGYEHTPDSVSTPTNKSREGKAEEAVVSVDFNDMNTTYLKLNLPVLNGAYVKAGTIETDLDIKEVMGSGSTYKNVSTEGTMMAVGYQSFLGESGFGIRFEGGYMELDNVTTSNGVAVDGQTLANGGRNQIDAKNLEGATAKIAITYTFGRN